MTLFFPTWSQSFWSNYIVKIVKSVIIIYIFGLIKIKKLYSFFSLVQKFDCLAFYFIWIDDVLVNTNFLCFLSLWKANVLYFFFFSLLERLYMRIVYVMCNDVMWCVYIQSSWLYIFIIWMDQLGIVVVVVTAVCVVVVVVVRSKNG